MNYDQDDEGWCQVTLNHHWIFNEIQNEEKILYTEKEVTV